MSLKLLNHTSSSLLKTILRTYSNNSLSGLSPKRRTSSTRYISSLNTSVKCTKLIIRSPSSSAPRESPTPLVFLRTNIPIFISPLLISTPAGSSNSYADPSNKHIRTPVGPWRSSQDNQVLSNDIREHPDLEDRTDWEGWSSMFSEKGYTSIEIDISLQSYNPVNPSNYPNPSDSTHSLWVKGSTRDILKEMSTLLSTEIRLLGIPFPPILISMGKSTVLSQSYVGDYPVQGMVLVDPPKEPVWGLSDLTNSLNSPGSSGSLGSIRSIESSASLNRGNLSSSSLSLESSDSGEEDREEVGRVKTSEKSEGKKRLEKLEFKYEPTFPILLLGVEDRMEDVLSSRLGQAATGSITGGRWRKGVEVESMKDGLGEETRLVRFLIFITPDHKIRVVGGLVSCISDRALRYLSRKRSEATL
ncbi:hypothetical protein TREMEDRAFT_62058 [Tremella mesenterica DSM 1558]|uniref:uncharacterized protein n=1 Tax=Tremella mesenterica (strain ATCC 24925 / CBS 8224 / DSM 1558 / NBRC 9311 / NRRL Y-6157 / RJB 2259-6 / UBC 559-6) TaxID=578456 RepID=UPI0003F49127|nr:uncharacterized protein TREMEDRAFT_62058 [Tremella mesenterica DSM 1558]EIW70295.1 hypothetical protein TREMEDRAFT_62058 [Tremella mesenterica DSM 1558]